MGSDGYVWARTWADKKQVTQHGLEIEKHWYNFMTWGRCAYQPCDAEHSLGLDFWISELATRFPELSTAPGSARVLYLAWTNASAIVPQVNRLLIGKWVNDFQWNPEGCFNRDGFPDPENGNGFVDVRKFGQYLLCGTSLCVSPLISFSHERFLKMISSCSKCQFDFSNDFFLIQVSIRRRRYTPVEGVDLITLKDFVEATVNGKALNGTTPLQVVSRLQSLAAATEKAVQFLHNSVRTIGAELDATASDLSVFAALGRYYAGKLCGATELGLYDATKDAAHKEKAVACLQEALTHWREYTALATAQYTYPQLLARVALLDIEGFTENVQADIRIAQEA